MDELVPVAKSLGDLYPPDALDSQGKRWARLKQQFSKTYGREPDFVARSPGRVNIIGEHIDYSLYEVLPMAIAADVLVAVSTHKSSKNTKISISNLNSEKFKPNEFTISAENDVDIDSTTHEWTNYFKAGLQGALSLLRSRDTSFSSQGMSVLVDGTVPSGGGLSSSAAFVCASALAVLRANSDQPISKKDLVELAVVSERSVGVNSGGMDQAASVFSIRGDALSVSFSPSLHAKTIAFPKTDPPITFMIAQSFVAADKHVTAPEFYNLRVVECTLAAEYLAAKLGLTLEPDAGPLGTSLRGLQNAYFVRHPPPPNTDDLQQLSKMAQLVETHLVEKEGYDRTAIAARLATNVRDLEKKYMTKFPVRASRFLLRQRALHVFTEATRVQRFKALLQAPTDSHQSPDELMHKLGSLMNETQVSCRVVYDCSCPELDELCSIARDAGSYGSRLTGAGWGGCSVHLVPKGKVQDVREAWVRKYYGVKFPGMEESKLQEAVVVSEPGQGSMIIEMQRTREGPSDER